MRENKLQKECMNYLTPLILAGRCFCINHHGEAYGRSGLPDLQILLDGVTVACELKQPGKHILSSDEGLHQIAVLRKMKRAGAVAFWTNDYMEFREVISAVSKIAGKQSSLQLGTLQLRHGELL